MPALRSAMTQFMAGHRVLLCFLLCLLLLRSAVLDWYRVPSSSMYPTLLVGDSILSYRLAYDVKLPLTNIVLCHVADPLRGDIVTFISPADGVRLVKRIIGVPGDIVEMRDEQVIINGMPLSYSAAAQAGRERRMADYEGTQLIERERLAGVAHGVMLLPQRLALRSFGPMTVPSGQYLMLGDNRDDSHDSRYIGFVPRAQLTGRVRRVMFSLDPQHYYLPRMQRFAAVLAALK